MGRDLKGLLGVICIADDIIVHGKTEQEAMTICMHCSTGC